MKKTIKRLLFVLAAATLIMMIIGFSQMVADNTTVQAPDPGFGTSDPVDPAEEGIDDTQIQEPDEKIHQDEANPPVEASKDRKVAYLTFDDGPSPKVTPLVLDILKQYDIKATFFVIGQMAELHPEILKQVDTDGHLICNHTYSHRYRIIYASPDSFMADLKKGGETLTNILGHALRSNVMRFPSGSFGKDRAPIRERVLSEGYQYVDWNVTIGDGEIRNLTAEIAMERLKKESQGKDRLVVLIHDSNAKKLTPEVLPTVIEYLKSQGYAFETLDTYQIERRK